MERRRTSRNDVRSSAKSYGSVRCGNVQVGADSIAGGPGFQPLYKLHGSCNWQAEAGEPLLIMGNAKTGAIQRFLVLRGYHDQFAARLSAWLPRARSFAEWEKHPQGRAVASLPLFTIDQIGDCEDFEQFGISAIIAARREHPAAYLRACVALLPKHRFYRRLFSSCGGLRHARPRGVLIWLPALL
jgi:hypothetical protein